MTMFRLTPWSLEALPVTTGGLLLKLYSIQSLSLSSRSSPDVHLHNDTDVTENRAVFFFSFLGPFVHHTIVLSSATPYICRRKFLPCTSAAMVSSEVV